MPVGWLRCGTPLDLRRHPTRIGEEAALLTNEEAELGIGRRVRNTETNQIGMPEGVEHRSAKNYWIREVVFRGERD